MREAQVWAMFSIIPKVDGIIDDEGKKYGNYATLKFA